MAKYSVNKKYLEIYVLEREPVSEFLFWNRFISRITNNYDMKIKRWYTAFRIPIYGLRDFARCKLFLDEFKKRGVYYI